MTEHIYRVLETIGGEKSITIRLLNKYFSVEVSLFLFGFKITNINRSQEIITILNFRIASLYLYTQRLKIFLLNNFEVK